uniref:S-acyltransferase n=1 Tax=Araucaria cunninghamii TaxID=56994 RepID=A0A0D6R0X1_ARACU
MAWNVFKYCTALRGLGSFMVILVLGIVGATYYAVVIVNYGPAIQNGGFETAKALFVLFCFHFLLVMLLWSYFAVVLTDPGGVPPDWTPAIDEECGETVPLTRSYESTVPALNSQSPLTVNGPSKSRFQSCRKCNQLRPPRSHHCSICGRCILKMDHHCIWVINCVGARNYKFFLLFLFYTFLETTLATCALLPQFISFFGKNGSSQISEIYAPTFLGFVLNVAFALSVLGFIIMHISLVASNTTTIEACERKTDSKVSYDLGRKKNFEQVFGKEKFYWFIPVYSYEDANIMHVVQGLEYPHKPCFNDQDI